VAFLTHNSSYLGYSEVLAWLSLPALGAAFLDELDLLSRSLQLIITSLVSTSCIIHTDIDNPPNSYLPTHYLQHQTQDDKNSEKAVRNQFRQHGRLTRTQGLQGFQPGLYRGRAVHSHQGVGPRSLWYRLVRYALPFPARIDNSRRRNLTTLRNSLNPSKNREASGHGKEKRGHRRAKNKTTETDSFHLSNSAAVNNQTNEGVAIKKVTNVFSKKILAKRALREIKLLQHFRGHRNVSKNLPRHERASKPRYRNAFSQSILVCCLAP
jgi:hypothetical protein